MSAALRRGDRDARVRLIRRIHVAKRELALAEDSYRGLLLRIGGHESCAGMGLDQLSLVWSEFQRLGAGIGRPGRPRHKAQHDPAFGKAQALWLSLWNLGAIKDASDRALARFIAHQTGLASPQWLRRAEDKVKVIEALKDWLARLGVDWSASRHPAECVVRAQYTDLGIAAGGEISALAAVARGAIGRDPETNRDWAGVSSALGRALRRRG
jgi:phage gp16-like protein